MKQASSGVNATQVLLGVGASAALVYLLGLRNGRRRHAQTMPAAAPKRSPSLPLWLAGAAAAGLGALMAGNPRVRQRAGNVAHGGQRIEVEKSIQIAAAPDDVYELWCDYENFPRFMARVEEVRSLGDDRSHWVVKGPAGSRVEWDSVIIARAPGRLLAWHSEPGAQVQNSGWVNFQASPTGTLVTVRIAYTPPVGAIGHAVATLMGRSPAQDLGTDLERMKAFIESGGWVAGGSAGPDDDSARLEASRERPLHH